MPDFLYKGMRSGNESASKPDKESSNLSIPANRMKCYGHTLVLGTSFESSILSFLTSLCSSMVEREPETLCVVSSILTKDTNML